MPCRLQGSSPFHDAFIEQRDAAMLSSARRPLPSCLSTWLAYRTPPKLYSSNMRGKMMIGRSKPICFLAMPSRVPTFLLFRNRIRPPRHGRGKRVDDDYFDYFYCYATQVPLIGADAILAFLAGRCRCRQSCLYISKPQTRKYASARDDGALFYDLTRHTTLEYLFAQKVYFGALMPGAGRGWLVCYIEADVSHAYFIERRIFAAVYRRLVAAIAFASAIYIIALSPRAVDYYFDIRHIFTAHKRHAKMPYN